MGLIVNEHITLRAWTGFAPRGRIWVQLAPEDRAEPSAEQVAALRYLRANDAAVASVALGRLLKAYPAHRRAHNENVTEDDEEMAAFERSIGIVPERRLPVIRTREALQEVLKLRILHVLDVARDGVAYVGFQFAAEWDEEHGAGVLMHRRRVVDIGEADVAFVAWRAEEDAVRSGT